MADMTWPDFLAPQRMKNPPEGWEDPRLPDFRAIWAAARECGYSVGLHGSMVRDCDMIAAPWTEEATDAETLIDTICAAINAIRACKAEPKPHGRIGICLQIDGWFKLIDLSIMPRIVT